MERKPESPLKDPQPLLRAAPFSLDRLLSHVDPGPDRETEEFVRQIYEQRRREASLDEGDKSSR